MIPTPLPVVDVRDLRMRYGTKDVLHGVDLRIDRGEVVVLLGPNGAGFRAPSDGTVEVLGTEPLHATEDWRARIGVVLQSWRDHGRWRLVDLLAHVISFYEPDADDVRSPYAVGELLDRVGLAEQGRKRVTTFSAGQRRRLDVAVGIAGRPELLFLDEPTAGFDPRARRDFHEFIRVLADQEETIILLTTHDLGEAERLADRIRILDQGSIVAAGTAAELARQVAGEDEVRWTAGGQSGESWEEK